MNKLQAEIEKQKSTGPSDVFDDYFLALLAKKAQQLGANPSDHQCEEAYKQAVSEHFQYLRSRRQAAMADLGWDGNMEENSKVIRNVFRDLGLLYRGYVNRRNEYVYETALSFEDKSLRMRVCVEPNPGVFRIEAVYPFRLEPEFGCALSEKLEAGDSGEHISKLQYNAADQELSCSCCFPVGSNIQEIAFQDVFLDVLTSAQNSYDALHRLCRQGDSQM